MSLGSFPHAVKKIATSFESLDDQEMIDLALNLGFEARKTTKHSTPFLQQAFALVQSAAKRHLGMTHFDVQLLGGLAMSRGQVIEMRTGEGKTLTATLPLFVHALSRRGALLATTNDYLAKRDATEMFPIYKALGMTVGVIQTDMSREQRRAAYGCDITYGTMKEFGFDFLRDHSAQREQQQRELGLGDVADPASALPVHRKPNFVLIDEADSILIDDARTPLIIAAPADGSSEEQQRALYDWAATHSSQFSEDSDYWYDRERQSVDLTPAGTGLVRSLPKPAVMAGAGLLEIYDFMERAIKVHRDQKLDRDYVVRDGEIVIVDEATGRISEGRRWSRGVHQAIEAKEGVEITMDTSTQAKVTVQSFVRRYPHIAGMTGTAYSARREFRKFYGAGVSVIPPNRPSRRIELPTRYAFLEADKFNLIVADVLKIHQTGRPVLIGTRSIAKSVLLSKLLTQEKIPHEVLNAREIEREADIVSGAGVLGRITVATNMAGRGTDIKINDEVIQLGGLHVVGTEVHESSRIDQQLFGRCGRQGDPGTVQQYLSAQDTLLDSAFGKMKADRFRLTGKSRPARYWIRLFKRAQHKVESQHYRARRILMYNEKELAKSQREMGLDPVLDNFE